MSKDAHATSRTAAHPCQDTSLGLSPSTKSTRSTGSTKVHAERWCSEPRAVQRRKPLWRARRPVSFRGIRSRWR